MRSLIAAACFLGITSPLGAGMFGKINPAHSRGSNITLRKRLHVNTLITEPGTVELDWSSLYSFTTTNFTMPSAIKWTPEGSSVLWGRTEYSVAFDSISNAEFSGGRQTQFSQALTATATIVVLDGDKLDIAIAPQSTFFLRDESGARLGATAVARYDFGRNSVGGTLSWTGATHSSANNPAATLDAGCGFGRRLAAEGFWGRVTPHVNLVWEKSSGVERMLSVFEGFEYQITERLSFDVSGQQYGVAGGQRDRQIAAGITFNLGKWNRK